MPAGKQLSDANPSGTALGQSAADLIALWGATPAAQRSSSLQATSNISAASFISVSTNLAPWAAEVSNTLIALGAWKGS